MWYLHRVAENRWLQLPQAPGSWEELLQMCPEVDRCFVVCDGRLLEAGTAWPSAATEVRLQCVPRLVGGKGGFGSTLRDTRARVGQRVSEHREACRDLDGRRIGDLERAEREAEAAEAEKAAQDIERKRKSDLRAAEEALAARREVAARAESERIELDMESAVLEALSQESVSLEPTGVDSCPSRDSSDKASSSAVRSMSDDPTRPAMVSSNAKRRKLPPPVNSILKK